MYKRSKEILLRIAATVLAWIKGSILTNNPKMALTVLAAISLSKICKGVPIKLGGIEKNGSSLGVHVFCCLTNLSHKESVEIRTKLVGGEDLLTSLPLSKNKAAVIVNDKTKVDCSLHGLTVVAVDYDVIVRVTVHQRGLDLLSQIVNGRLGKHALTILVIKRRDLGGLSVGMLKSLS